MSSADHTMDQYYQQSRDDIYGGLNQGLDYLSPYTDNTEGDLNSYRGYLNNQGQTYYGPDPGSSLYDQIGQSPNNMYSNDMSG